MLHKQIFRQFFYGHLVCLMCFVSLIRCISLQAKDWDGGISLGLTVYVGNKTDRIGVFINGWLRYDFVQINPGIRVYYNFKNLGPPGKYWECDMYGGLLLGWGKRDSIDNPFITSVSNHTMRRYSFGYSHNIYCDGMQTSQRTGTVAIQMGKINLITENDLWGDNKDRYRTASATVQYRDRRTIFGLSIMLWTSENGTRVTDSNYPSRRGYKEPSRYGGYSHGILCAQIQQDLGYGQNFRADVGIDAEQIRNAFQNKLIHDYIFLPQKWVKTPGSHVPMLDTGHQLYLYQPGQQIRKPTPYFNIAANPSLFY